MHINKYLGYVTKLSELKWFRTLKFGKDASDVTGVWRPQVRVGSEIVMSFVQVWELITPMLDLQSGVVKQHQSVSMLLISRISFKQPSRDLKVTSFRSFIYRYYKYPQYANEIRRPLAVRGSAPRSLSCSGRSFGDVRQFSGSCFVRFGHQSCCCSSIDSPSAFHSCFARFGPQSF